MSTRPWFWRHLKLTTLQRWFIFIHLSSPYLASFVLTFSNAHYHCSLQQQLRVVCNQLLQADYDGSTAIFNVAYLRRTRSWLFFFRIPYRSHFICINFAVFVFFISNKWHDYSAYFYCFIGTIISQKIVQKKKAFVKNIVIWWNLGN